MDNADYTLLREIARLKLQARKLLRIEIDVEGLVHDARYARGVLTQCESTEDEEFLLLVLTLKQKLGLLDAPRQATLASNGDDSRPPLNSKYKFGVRG
jgi:hypothetical protein